jgi:hypothetical protein
MIRVACTPRKENYHVQSINPVTQNSARVDSDFLYICARQLR